MSTGEAIPLGKLTMDASGLVSAAKQADSQIVKLAQSIERSMVGGAVQTKKLTGALGQIAGKMLDATRATTELAKNMQGAFAKAMGANIAQTKKLTTAIGHVGGAMTGATKEFARGSRESAAMLGRLRQELAKLGGQMMAFNQQVNQGFKGTQDSIQKLSDIVSELASQMRTGFAGVIAEQQRLNQQAAQSEQATVRHATAWTRFGEVGRRAVDSLGRALEPLRDKARQIGVAIGGLTAATAALTGAGIKVGSSYEQSMARVKAITMSTDEEFKALGAEAQRLGVVTVHSAKDAAEGMAMLAQGGYKASTIIKAMPAVFQLVDVAQTDTAGASRVLINVMEAMQVPAEHLEGAVDMLARALTLGGNDLQEFADAFKYVGPSAKALNIPLNEVAATIQILGKQGIQASMAGTTLRQTFTALTMMSPKMKKDFKELGIEIYDQFGKLKNSLPELLDELQRGFARSTRKGGAMGNIMQDFNARAGGGLTALLNAIEGHRGVIAEAAAEVGKAAGEHYSAGVAEGMRDTLKSRATMVLGTLQGFGITLVEHMGQSTRNGLTKLNDWIAANKTTIDGYIRSAWDGVSSFTTGAVQSAGRLYQAWAPTLKDIGQWAVRVYQGFMQWFQSLPPGVQDALKVAAALTGVSLALTKIGGMIPILGTFATAIGGLINPLGGVSMAIRVLLPLLTGGAGLIPMLGMLFNPVGLVVMGTVALTALVGYMTGDVAGAFKGLGEIIDTVTLGSLTRLLDLLKELKGIFDDYVAAAKAQMESNARATGMREQVSTRYGADVLKDYDSADAANKALSEHNRQVQEAVEHRKRTGSYRSLDDVGLVREHEAKQYRMRTGGYEKQGDYDLLKQADALAEKYAQAQARYEQSAANAEKMVQQSKQQREQSSLNEQVTKQQQQWRDQQMAQDQQAMAPQIAQGQIAQQQAMAQQQPGSDANLDAIQSGQYRGYFNSMSAKQAAQYFASAPKAVADALKPDKESGQVNADQANVVAQTYIAGLKQVGGLNQQAVDQLANNLQQAIARIKNAPPALRDMLIDQLNQVDLKMHQIFNPAGPYAQQFAQSLGLALKQNLEAAIQAAEQRANAAVAALGAGARLIRQQNPQNPLAGAVAGHLEAGQQRIKAQQDRVKKAQQDAGAQGLAPADKAIADAAAKFEQGELQRIIAEEAQQVANLGALKPANITRLTIGNINRGGQNSIRDLRGNGMVDKKQIGQIRQQWAAFMQMLQQATQLQGNEKEQMLANAANARAAFDTMVNAANRGKAGMEDFKDAAKKAADQANALADAEKQLTDDEIANMNARGVFTKQQQQQAQQQAQQAMQMIQQQVMQPLQQMAQQQAQATAQGAQALGTAALTGGGLDDLQEAIKNAKTPQDALSLVKGFLQAQAAQTLLNIKNVASTNDPIIGSFGAQGQLQGNDNLDYVMSAGGPLVDFYKNLLSQINAIDAKLKKMPHMASGGIVTSPTTALIGEAGPEAVLPLNRLQQMIPQSLLQLWFGNPGNIFPGAGGRVNNFAINPGGFGINPLGLSPGNLGLFDRMFGNASRTLNWQSMLGNPNALGMLSQWSKYQQTAEDALGFMYQHRRINLQPGSRYSAGRDLYGDVAGGVLGRAINPRATGYTENQGHQFNMTMHVNQTLQQEHISQAFDWFEAEARKRGADGTGRSRLRSVPTGQMARGPLSPAGLSR